jgi:hypothetical protein
VAGGELHADRDGRARIVFSHRHALAVLSAELVRPWRRQIPGVAALAALSLVGLVLPGESSAEELVVVVIGGRAESVPDGRTERKREAAEKESRARLLTSTPMLSMAARSVAHAARSARPESAQGQRAEELNV